MTDLTRLGRCLCGGVTFRVSGSLGEALNCYCSICRRAHSAAFRTRVVVEADQIEWMTGRELIASYESSPGHDRQFCKTCGSRLATVLAGQSQLGLSLALLEDTEDVAVTRHIFVADKPGWVQVPGGAPQFPGMPG